MVSVIKLNKLHYVFCFFCFLHLAAHVSPPKIPAAEKDGGNVSTLTPLLPRAALVQYTGWELLWQPDNMLVEYATKTGR